MSRVLYIRHLPPLITERKLERLFSRYGAVLNVEVMAHPDSEKSACLGVVTMGSENGAWAAIEALHRSQFFGGALSVRGATNGYDATASGETLR
jgi:RNA recognition motif-containing protein